MPRTTHCSETGALVARPLARRTVLRLAFLRRGDLRGSPHDALLLGCRSEAILLRDLLVCGVFFLRDVAILPCGVVSAAVFEAAGARPAFASLGPALAEYQLPIARDSVVRIRLEGELCVCARMPDAGRPGLHPSKSALGLASSFGSACPVARRGGTIMEKNLAAPRPSAPTASRTTSIARTGMIAAVYAAATLVALLLLQGLAWGPVQFRISEAVCVLALLTPNAIPGLTIGCALANLIALAINGTGALGMLDVVFGSLATCLGALWCWKMRERPAVAVLGPVIANALIVPAYLPLLLQGMGFYTIPFTTIALDGAYIPMYLFGLVATGIGEAIVMYVLGLPLLAALKKSGAAKILSR